MSRAAPARRSKRSSSKDQPEFNQASIRAAVAPVAPKSNPKTEADGDIENAAHSAPDPPSPSKANMPLALKIIQRKVSCSAASGDQREPRVLRESLRSVLQQKHVETNSCIQLPFAVLFFFFYTVVIFQHEEVFMVHNAETAIRNFVDTSSCRDFEPVSLGDAMEPNDFWKWLQGSVVCPGSQWFQQEDNVGRPIPTRDWGRLLGSKRLFGGLLLEQLRSVKRPCEANLAYEWDCYPTKVYDASPFGVPPENKNSTNVTYFDREGFVAIADWQSTSGSRRLESKGSSLWAWEWLEDKSATSARFPFFLLEHDPIERLQDRVAYLHDGQWIDSQTLQITAKALLVNAEVGLVSHLTLLFNFARTGGLVVSLKLQTSPLAAYRNMRSPIADLIWLATLTMIAIAVGRDITISKREKRLAGYFKDFWNLLDLVTIALGILVMIGFVVQRLSINRLSQKMANVSTVEESVSLAHLNQMHDMHQTADSIFNGIMWYRLLLGDYVFCYMLRFFKAFRAQPRLALVTATIYTAGADLFHFSIVFVSIFGSFAFASVILFGRRMVEFSNYFRAGATCFAIICGDYDGAWHQVAAEHPVTAMIWFWCFIILMYFVMLNMVLAIVLDIYTEVRANAVGGDPLWVQTSKVVHSLRTGGVIHLIQSKKYEREALDDLALFNDEVTFQELKRICPQMDDNQLEDIFDECERWEARQSAKGICLSDALMMVGVMHTDVKSIQDKLDVLVGTDETKIPRKRSKEWNQTSNRSRTTSEKEDENVSEHRPAQTDQNLESGRPNQGQGEERHQPQSQFRRSQSQPPQYQHQEQPEQRQQLLPAMKSLDVAADALLDAIRSAEFELLLKKFLGERAERNPQKGGNDAENPAMTSMHPVLTHEERPWKQQQGPQQTAQKQKQNHARAQQKQDISESPRVVYNSGYLVTEDPDALEDCASAEPWTQILPGMFPCVEPTHLQQQTASAAMAQQGIMTVQPSTRQNAFLDGGSQTAQVVGHYDPQFMQPQSVNSYYGSPLTYNRDGPELSAFNAPARGILDTSHQIGMGVSSDHPNGSVGQPGMFVPQMQPFFGRGMPIQSVPREGRPYQGGVIHHQGMTTHPANFGAHPSSFGASPVSYATCPPLAWREPLGTDPGAGAAIAGQSPYPPSMMPMLPVPHIPASLDLTHKFSGRPHSEPQFQDPSTNQFEDGRYVIGPPLDSELDPASSDCGSDGKEITRRGQNGRRRDGAHRAGANRSSKPKRPPWMPAANGDSGGT